VVNPKVRLDRDAVAAFCRKWRIRDLSLFGSALRDDLGPESDMDFLVFFVVGAGCRFQISKRWRAVTWKRRPRWFHPVKEWPLWQP